MALVVMARAAEGPAGGGDAELLKLVAEGRKAAMENLRSWKGEKSWTRQKFTPDGKAVLEADAKTQFAYDADLKGRVWRSDSTYYGSGPNGKDMGSIDGALRMDGKYFGGA
jgi:hypothetical protein